MLQDNLLTAEEVVKTVYDAQHMKEDQKKRSCCNQDLCDLHDTILPPVLLTGLRSNFNLDLIPTEEPRHERRIVAGNNGDGHG